MDATAILTLLNCVSKHFNLDYDAVLRVCKLTNTDDMSMPVPSELEFISVQNKGYLFDSATRRVFTNEQRPRLIGHLCKTSLQVIEA